MQWQAASIGGTKSEEKAGASDEGDGGGEMAVASVMNSSASSGSLGSSSTGMRTRVEVVEECAPPPRPLPPPSMLRHWSSMLSLQRTLLAAASFAAMSRFSFSNTMYSDSHSLTSSVELRAGRIMAPEGHTWTHKEGFVSTRQGTEHERMALAALENKNL